MSEFDDDEDNLPSKPLLLSCVERYMDEHPEEFGTIKIDNINGGNKSSGSSGTGANYLATGGAPSG